MAFWRLFLVTLSIVTAGLVAQAQEGSVGVSMIENSSANFSNPWGTSFFSLATAPMNQIGSNASVFSYNYIALNYKLSKTRRFSFRPVWQYATSGNNEWGSEQATKSELGDAHFVYADYEIAALGPANVSTSFKLYAPTSKSSSEDGMILKFRPETYITMNVGRYDTLTYCLKPDFYLQSRTSTFDAKHREYMTDVFKLEHYVEYGWSFSKTFALKPSVGFTEFYTNPSKNPKVPVAHSTNAKMALGLDIRARRGLMFTLSAENETAVAGKNVDVAWGRPPEMSVLLITNAAM